eukprot:scaffold9592_cov118-Isochrysis_galbana.AAC.1
MSRIPRHRKVVRNFVLSLFMWLARSFLSALEMSMTEGGRRVQPKPCDLGERQVGALGRRHLRKARECHPIVPTVAQRAGAVVATDSLFARYLIQNIAHVEEELLQQLIALPSLGLDVLCLEPDGADGVERLEREGIRCATARSMCNEPLRFLANGLQPARVRDGAASLLSHGFGRLISNTEFSTHIVQQGRPVLETERTSQAQCCALPFRKDCRRSRLGHRRLDELGGIEASERRGSLMHAGVPPREFTDVERSVVRHWFDDRLREAKVSHRFQRVLQRPLVDPRS